MKIVQIHINEFGPLVDKTFDFSDTLTIVRGDNESGKSTLMLFIKFMLYGLSKRAKTSSVSEMERALSHSTGTASGYMIVSHLGILYRIDRQARRSGKTISEKVQLTEVESGLKCDYGNSPGEFLLGIPLDVFENSCNITQLGCSTVKGEQMGTAIKNLLSSADESIDSDKALKALEAVRVKFLHKNKKGGSIYALSTLKDELSARYTKAVEDSCETERIESDIQKYEIMISDVSAKQKLADELFSKINLRSVIKQFDKLHEYEEEKSKTEERLDEIAKITQKADLKLDRAFVASITGVKNEILLANKEKKAASEALDAVFTNNDPKVNLLISTANANGGIESLESFFSKTTKAIKSKTAAAISFFTLALICGALGFVKLPSPGFPINLVALPLCAAFLVLSVVFLCARSRSVKFLTAKCRELGISQKDINEFLDSIKKALVSNDAKNELCEQRKAELCIKERVLSAATSKATELFKLYGFSVTDASPEALIGRAEACSADVTRLCDEQDALSGKLVALNSKIREISFELTDYNEHQTRRKVSAEILAMSEEDIRTAKTNKDFYANQLKALGEKKIAAERALMERKYSTYDPFDISSKLAKTVEQLEAQTKNYNALELAIEAIETASANLRNTMAPQIRSLSGEYIKAITDGKYDSLTVSDTLELSMNEDGFLYNIDSFSTGTKDAAYLSLRLSLLSLLDTKEIAPLLMDETLAMIDDKRATKLLNMLFEHSKEKGQCILFSCHDREERLCREENIPFCTVQM